MKKNLLFTIIIILCLGFSSCETRDEYWVKSELNIETNPEIRTNGTFETYATIYSNDIDINSARQDIIDIILKNAWIKLSGDFSRGDEVRIFDITINGVTLYLDYYLNVSSNISPSYTFENDPVFINFMYDAVRSLATNNRLEIRVRGSSYMSRGALLVDIESNLDILVTDY